VKLLASALFVLLLPACASRPAPMPQETDIFDYDYEFRGEFDGRHISGSVSFQPLGTSAVRYILVSDAGMCSGELRPPQYRWVQLSCGGMSISFARAGRVQGVASATLRTMRQTERRECRSWTTTSNGQRVCSQWGTVIVDVPVTARGTLHVERVSDVVLM
jgi:hypothetical protein